jgi:nickel-dependent lactate racemase
MRLRFAYDGPEGQPFEVPDARLAILAPREGSDRDDDALYRNAFEQPVEGPRLREAARGAGRVLVLVDDATRSTPAARILPWLARELEQAGVRDEQVTVLTAQGTHRRMSEEELHRKLGPFRARWRVAQHDCKASAELHAFGTTREGLPVVANKLLAEADLAVGVGHVVSHGIMGFSGGAKIVLPGIAGEASEAWTHWRASFLPEEELLGVPANPIRRAIEDGARLAGLDAVLNIATDARGRVQRACYGDFVAAQRACAEAAAEHERADLDGPADVVVVEAAPADRDVWQSVKGLYAGTVAVAEGGTLILAAPNPEGVADNHPTFAALAGKSLDEIRARVERGQEQDVIGAAIAAFVARIRARSRVALVSSGVRADDARRMGMEPFASVQDALDDALREAGRDASVAVLRRGGTLLPVVGGRNDHLAAGARGTPSLLNSSSRPQA